MKTKYFKPQMRLRTTEDEKMIKDLEKRLSARFPEVTKLRTAAYIIGLRKLAGEVDKIDTQVLLNRMNGMFVEMELTQNVLLEFFSMFIQKDHPKMSSAAFNDLITRFRSTQVYRQEHLGKYRATKLDEAYNATPKNKSKQKVNKRKTNELK